MGLEYDFAIFVILPIGLTALFVWSLIKVAKRDMRDDIGSSIDSLTKSGATCYVHTKALRKKDCGDCGLPICERCSVEVHYKELAGGYNTGVRTRSGGYTDHVTKYKYTDVTVCPLCEVQYISRRKRSMAIGAVLLALGGAVMLMRFMWPERLPGFLELVWYEIAGGTMLIWGMAMIVHIKARHTGHKAGGGSKILGRREYIGSLGLVSLAMWKDLSPKFDESHKDTEARAGKQAGQSLSTSDDMTKAILKHEIAFNNTYPKSTAYYMPAAIMAAMVCLMGVLNFIRAMWISQGTAAEDIDIPAMPNPELVIPVVMAAVFVLGFIALSLDNAYRKVIIGKIEQLEGKKQD
jgi:hypothetical protein